MKARILITGLLLALLAGIASVPSASAQKVGNPGSFAAKLITGSMKVKNNEFGFDESQNINFSGTVNKAGGVNIPSITFPDTQLNDVPVVGSVTVKINVVNPTTGTLNPNTGVASLRLKVWIKIDGVPFGGGCRVGSASSPIDLNTLITGVTSPPGPNQPISGIPYNPSDGTMRIVNNSFGVPASSDCGPGASAVNDLVDSPAGNNRASFDLKFAPVLTRGVNPNLTVSPASGTAPFLTALSAAGTTAPAGIASYQWDFDGNGTFDSTTTTPAASYTYTSGGTFNARLKVTDNDGDSAEVTRPVTVAAFPDLSIGSTHGTFRVGSVGTYRLSVKNEGYAATIGATSVRATLPNGLTYSGVSGSGWTCAPDGADVVCSRAPSIARNAAAPDLDLSVNVGPAALGTVNPSFRVFAAGDNRPSNDITTDLTEVTGTDLAITKTHAAHGMRPGQDPANLFVIDVTNAGNAPTSGATTVTDTLPAGFTFVSADGGPTWSCAELTGTLTCTRASSIPAGAAVAPIELRVAASLDPGSTGTSVTNQASVSTASDVNSANDLASDPTLILDGPDLAINKTHAGNFVAGSQESYELAVRNDGPLPTTGPITVTDELPAGLTFVSASGNGWICAEQAGTVECTNAGPIAAESAGTPIELLVSVGEAAIPEVTNTATVETVGDGNPANDSASDRTLVRAIDLQVEKTHDGVLRTGRDGIYRLKVSNVGDSVTAGPAVVTDQLPASLGFISAIGGADWQCGEAAGLVTCQHDGAIEAGESAAAITLKVAVGESAAPEVTNSATVNTVDDFNSANNTGSDQGVVVDLDAAVAIERTGSFEIGRRGTYLVSVDNRGSKPTTGPLTTTIDLAVGLTPVSASGPGWACTVGGAEVTCVRSTALAAETSAADISLRVEVGAGTASPVNTVATVSAAGDRNPANDSANDQTSIAHPDLNVSSSHNGPFLIGTPAAYRLEVRNAGSGSTSGPVRLTDVLPDGVDFVRASGAGWECDEIANVVFCELSSLLPSGASATDLNLQVLPDASALQPGEKSGTVQNSVSVTTEGDTVSGNDLAEDPTDLVAIDLALYVSGAQTVTAGSATSYTLSVENLGSARTSSPVRIDGSLPFGLEVTSMTGQGWNCVRTGQSFTCRRPADIAAGASATPIEIQTRAARGAGGTFFVGAGVSTTGDIEPANDVDSASTLIVTGPDLEPSLSARPGDGFRVGAPAVYSVAVKNAGTAATSSDPVVTVELGPGLTYAGVTGNGWTCTGETTVTCVMEAPLDSGASAKFDLAVTPDRNSGSKVTSSATAFTVGDTDADNDRVELETPITWVDLSLSRTHTADWVAGSTGRYSVKVQNVGGAATTGPVSVNETLPAGTYFRSANGTGWDCRAGGRELDCVHPSRIAAAATSSFEVNLDLVASAVPAVTGTSVLTTSDDVEVANDRASERIAVTAEAKPEPVRLSATVAGGAVRSLAEGSVYLKVTCPVAATAKCAGTVTLGSAGKVVVGRKRGRPVKRLLRLGTATYSVATGRTVPVRVVVPKASRTTLKKLKKVPARATTAASGLPSTSARLIVRAP